MCRSYFTLVSNKIENQTKLWLQKDDQSHHLRKRSGFKTILYSFTLQLTPLCLVVHIWFYSFRNKLHLSEELGKFGLPKSWCSNGRPTCPRMLFVFNPINPALSKNWDSVWMFNKSTLYTQFTSFRIQSFSYQLLQ